MALKARIHIFENDKGWKPSQAVVDALLKRMRKKGLRSDWEFCHADKFRELLFNSGEIHRSAIAARKTGATHKWRFFTESGQEL